VGTTSMHRSARGRSIGALAAVSHFLAVLAGIGSPCLRHCVHGAPIGGPAVQLAELHRPEVCANHCSGWRAGLGGDGTD
jgi:hypothetical protein